MGKKHDSIMLKMTDELIQNKIVSPLILKHRGKKDVWTDCSEVINLCEKEVEQWCIRDVFNVVDGVSNGGYPEFRELPLGEMRKKLLKLKNIVEAQEVGWVLRKSTFEFPLIKGQAQYAVTKGYADSIVLVDFIKNAAFKSFKNAEPLEFFIEIKTEQDFEDVGEIMRQLNEYRAYYSKWGSVEGSVKRFSEQVYGHRDVEVIFVLVTTNIQQEKKDFFIKQGYDVIEIGEV